MNAPSKQRFHEWGKTYRLSLKVLFTQADKVPSSVVSPNFVLNLLLILYAFE